MTVDATSRDTGVVRSATTGVDGFYTIPLLNPGAYQVKAALSGFRASIRENVIVVVNETVRADMTIRSVNSRRK